MSIQSQVIGKRYTISEAIGTGGMGTVFKAEDTHSHSWVAIKRLKADFVQNDPGMIERFNREAEALRQLNHPNIVKVLNAFVEGSDHYIIMEYFGGGDLGDWIKERGPLSARRVAEIALDLADALTRAHRLNIIHRDIKPSNVLMAEDETPRLTDFGVAHWQKSERVTQEGAMVGTLDYLAPEILNGAGADARTDIWSFGILLFEMLTGQRPFQGPNLGALMMAILKQPTPDLETLRPDLPVALVDLVYRMLDKNPIARIPSVRLIGAELENILQGAGGQIRRTDTFIGFQDDESQTIIMSKRFPTPTPSSTEPKHNLPANLTPFVGREAELTEIDRMLHDGKTRLITILAHGGMGKTRLGQEAAKRQMRFFPDGVFFVALAPLNSADNIVPTIADALTYKFSSANDQTQQLLDYLRDREILLIMDNFEHLLAGATLVSDLLKNSPRLKILVTSRESLNLQEETRYRISGMEFPDWETPEDALEYSAVKLFMQSAQRVMPGFELHAEDLTYVARICRLMQGMPLGIVLAAAWVEMFPLADIADEIGRSLDFLETDSRNVPDRHRSIRAVFDTSWQTLSDEEKSVFAKMSVFRGGFSRRAAQTITGASLKTLTTLVNKSLVLRLPDSGIYDVHELLRQYAESELKKLGIESEVKDAHCVYYTTALHDRHDAVRGKDAIKTLEDIESDVENVRLAWKWAVANKRYANLEQAMFTLQIFFNRLNRGAELRDLLTDAHGLTRPKDKHQQVVWCYLQIIAEAQVGEGGNKSIAKQREYIAIMEKLGEKFLQAPAYSNIAFQLSAQSQSDLAIPEAEKALALAYEAKNDWFAALMHNQLGWIYGYLLDNREKGWENTQKAVAIFEKWGDWFGLAFSYNILGIIAYNRGEVEDSVRYGEKALELQKKVGNRIGQANILNNIGWGATLTGDLDGARKYYHESLVILRELGNQTFIVDHNLGVVEYVSGNYEQARWHFLDALKGIGRDGFMVATIYAELVAIVALIHTREGNLEYATELLSSALNHPGILAAMDIRKWAERGREELESRLPKDIYQAAYERGRNRDRGKTYDELLTEFSRV